MTQTVPVPIQVNDALRLECEPAETVFEHVVGDVYRNRDLWRQAYEICAVRHSKLIEATAPESDDDRQ